MTTGVKLPPREALPNLFTKIYLGGLLDVSKSEFYRFLPVVRAMGIMEELGVSAERAVELLESSELPDNERKRGEMSDNWKPPVKQLTVRIEVEKHKKLKHILIEKESTFAEWINNRIDEYLARNSQGRPKDSQ